MPHLTAVILDVDGVLTRTAAVHERAWKRLFDDLLRARGDERPFTHADYLDHVDGKPRGDGVRDFLSSRGIRPDEEEVERLGETKNAFFHEALARHGVEVFEDVPPALDRWAAAGLRLAAVSSSRNAGVVLEKAGLRDRFEVLVDGRALEQAHLEGKPAPDMFLEAARRLGLAPDACAVVEDARSGVEAGRRGGFGLVVGLARHGGADALERHGADRVVTSLEALEDAPGGAGDDA